MSTDRWMNKDLVHSYNRILAIGNFVAKLCPTLVIPWTVACKAPLSIAFSRQEYWSGLSFPSPGDLPDPGIKPWSPALQEDSLLTELFRVHGVLLPTFSKVTENAKQCKLALHLPLSLNNKYSFLYFFHIFSGHIMCLFLYYVSFSCPSTRMWVQQGRASVFLLL